MEVAGDEGRIGEEWEGEKKIKGLGRFLLPKKGKKRDSILLFFYLLTQTLLMFLP